MSQPHSQALAGGDAAELAQFGYTQSMERRTGRFASFAVAFAFVSIATGIFTTYGSVLNSSGPVGIWTWPIAVVGQLAVAFVLGSLASRIPVTGYAYQWLRCGASGSGCQAISGATSTTFGVITSASAMRRLQFGLRLTF